MNNAKLINCTQNNNSKSENKIILSTPSINLDDHLNMIAEIIIERILEEKAKKIAV